MCVTLAVANDTAGVIITAVAAVGSTAGDGDGSGLRIGISYNTCQVSVGISFIVVLQGTAHGTIRNGNGTGSRLSMGNLARQVTCAGYGELRHIDIFDSGTASDIGKQTRMASRNGHAGNRLAISVKSAAEHR